MFSPLFQFAKKLEVPGKSDSYINDDIRPLPPSRRTWTKTTFIWFWLATSINIGGLSASSSILSLGLTVGQTALSDLTGSCIIMIAMIANGVQGAKWHIPFAVGNRAGWGVRGSWFVIANRLILSICWYGVQSWWGGQVVKNLIGAIWPSFYRMKNHFPLDAHMETNDFIGFIIFWTISLPLLAVNPERYRIPAVISSIAVTLGVLALMIWIIVKQGDGGPLLYTTEKVTGIKPLKGAALAWAFIRAVGTTVGAWGGGILYASDFSRYAVQPGDQIYGQAFVGPFCLIIGSFIGLIITSCAAGLYPDQPLLWRPYKLIEVIQTNEGTPGARAALFFLALTFLFSQWAVNISGCAITGGIDLSAMFPRYINTLRGPFVIAVIGFAITPWNLVNTANTFISVLGSYSTFLGPLAGIMITDYLVVRRQRVRLTHLYMAHPSSIYWFWHGINLKAVIVWVLSVGPSFPGFISVISQGKIKVPLGLVRTSYIGWMLGFAIASTLWTIINLIWPPPGLGEVDEVDVFGTFTEQINSGSGVSEKELDEGVSEKQAVEREVGHTLYI